MKGVARTAALALALASSLAASEKPKGISVSVRALPRVAIAPAFIQFSVEIEGGKDEDVHCASLEWDWGDGSKGSTDAECPEFVAGETKVERFFEAEHEYRRQARLSVRVRVVKEGKPLATNTVSVVITPERKNSFQIEQR
jgi:hypothetical protein